LIYLPIQPTVQQSSVTAPAKPSSDFGATPSNPPTAEKGDRETDRKVEKEEMATVRALVVDDDHLTRRLMERMLNVSHSILYF
jgi:hypothetical protein